jgi:hypothetical protein
MFARQAIKKVSLHKENTDRLAQRKGKWLIAVVPSQIEGIAHDEIK